VSPVGFEFDTETEFGAKTARRVVEDKLAWLTTVDSRGTPQPNPVWFLWDDGSFLIFSRPNQAKLANIARSSRVSFNFEATEDEEQITIFTGTAELIDRASISQEIFDRYAKKYAQGMININLPRPEYEAAYTEVIRFTPEKVRGW
jgi:PPOX class probable F420-dependent enzyme